MPLVQEAHQYAHRLFRLPEKPPRSTGGVRCTLCVHERQMAEGERGYCGLRENRGGRMAVMAGGPRAGVVRWYYDPLPTNCVAMDVCGERCTAGRANLAVFYGACSLNCLFCQNWHYADDAAGLKPRASASELAEAVTDQVACVCYFGGDPTPQLPHALATSRWARELGSVRICWETNGTMHPMYLQRMADLCLESGGTIKFDLKAYSDPIHIALTGFANRRTLENFTSAARRAKERADVPLVVASTLLVPGYVDEEEVGGLARLIASVSPDIPYRLLAFFPSFLMDNLPATSRSHAESCLAAAREAGLRSVALGNVRLLGDAY